MCVYIYIYYPPDGPWFGPFTHIYIYTHTHTYWGCLISPSLAVCGEDRSVDWAPLLLHDMGYEAGRWRHPEVAGSRDGPTRWGVYLFLKLDRGNPFFSL